MYGGEGEILGSDLIAISRIYRITVNAGFGYAGYYTVPHIYMSAFDNMKKHTSKIYFDFKKDGICRSLYRRKTEIPLLVLNPIRFKIISSKSKELTFKNARLGKVAKWIKNK